MQPSSGTTLTLARYSDWAEQGKLLVTTPNTINPAGQNTSDDTAGAVEGYNDADGNFVQRNRTEGHIIECDGERAIIAADAGADARGSEDYWAVGQLISVCVEENRIVGLIYQVDTQDGEWRPNDNNIVHIHIELVGEIRPDGNGNETFSTGIANYPYMGAVAHRIRAGDLSAIYAASTANAVQVGNISQDTSIPALISIDSLLSRHFAVVGTTGVGKSTAVTLLLRKIVTARPDIRILLLDPHNEFTAAFPEHAITIDSTGLELPFWMFQLDEFAEVIFRGRPPIPEEVDALRDFIPLAKDRYASENSGHQSALRKKEREASSVTADTPIPYRMIDLIKLIVEREGQLDGKADRPVLRSLKNRLEAILQDKRFRFMFQPKTPGDTLQKTISQIFRIPHNGKPICVFEMSGLPSEVMNSVVSVLSRFAFDLAVSSNGSIPTLLVCEEAHRYIPADPNAGFWPTRAAIARIAKEGRKYGVFLCVITQRPGELDSTILSQCNTIFAMRLGNERDKDIIRQAISGAAKSTTSFLSSIANREAIAFGEAVSTPMRMMFETVERKALPGSHIYDTQDKMRNGDQGAGLNEIIRRMRKQDDVQTFFDPETGQMPEVAFVGEPVDDQKPSISRLAPDAREMKTVQIEVPPPLAATAPETRTAATGATGATGTAIGDSARTAPIPPQVTRQPQPKHVDHRPQVPSRNFGQDAYTGARKAENGNDDNSTSSRDERGNDLIRSFRNR